MPSCQRASHSKSLPEAAKQTATQTPTPTCNHPKGADKQICILYVRRIYCCFLKQCSRKNTNYRKPLWSCTHHEEGIQHLTLGQLKPQLGLIKWERTVPQFPAGNQQMEEVYGSNTPNSSACYFYCLLSTRSWFNTNATYKLQHQDPDIWLRHPRRKKKIKNSDLFPHISVLPHWDILDTIRPCYFKWHYCITFFSIARGTHALKATLKALKCSNNGRRERK